MDSPTDLLAISDAEARRLLRIALEEGQKVQDRAERLEAELRKARRIIGNLTDSKYGHWQQALREGRAFIDE